MKRYFKKPTRLLQIRLSDKEYKDLDIFIKRFGVTKRDWILTVEKHLTGMNIIRDGKFYPRHHEYAYESSERWDKQLREDSYCEVCSKTNSKDYRGYWELIRHHHWGYEGDNAFKVIILCRKCHGFIHGKKLIGKPLDIIKKLLDKFKSG